ncbi:MAG: peptidase S24, partial [Candidatus Limnocylindria bacterium]
MRLYANSTEQFMTDAGMHRIAEKLRGEYITQIGHKPGAAEFASWQNSLTSLALLVSQADLNDHGVILEYQLGNTSRRLDALLTGHSSEDGENAVIVELKQWGETATSNAEGCVETFVGGRLRPVPHPSVQVGHYEQWLSDNHTAFYEDGIGLAGVSWLHNMQYDSSEELFATRHAEYLKANPLFTGDQSADLAAFLSERLSEGDGMPVMAKVLDSKYKPSKKLLDHTAEMVAGQQ